MAKNMAISQNEVAENAPITLYATSKDVAFLDPRKYNLVDGKIVSGAMPSTILDSSFYYIDTSTAEGEIKAKDVPQLEDIQVVENTTYVDDKGITRARVVLKVRNSSGRPLLGVDARIKVPESSGGQS